MSSWDEIRFESAGVVGRGILASLFATTRCVRLGEEHYRPFRDSGEPVIFAFWHSRILPLAHYHRDRNVVVLVSEHADGEYITRVIQHYGFGTVRGSSTRGGVQGLRGLIRAAREGRSLAITPDGPQGPARKAKSGALVAARVTGLPIVPVAAGASRAWRVPSWDRFLVPKPLARVTIAYGRPRTIPREMDDKDMARRVDSLETELDALTDRVDGLAPAEDAP